MLQCCYQESKGGIRMKQTVKKIIKVIFGNSDNLRFKIVVTSFVMAIIFCLLALVSAENNSAINIFTIMSSIFFSAWLIIVQGSDSASKFLYEFVRLLVFLLIFIYSLQYCAQFALGQSSNTLFVVLSCLGLFLCAFYFISKFADIFEFVKKVFRQIKIKLFNTANPAKTKFTALLENITAFWVAVGGFTVAIKVIVESIFQTLSYFE